MHPSEFKNRAALFGLTPDNTSTPPPSATSQVKFDAQTEAMYNGMDPKHYWQKMYDVMEGHAYKQERELKECHPSYCKYKRMIDNLNVENETLTKQLSEALGTLRCVADICGRNGIEQMESVHPMVLKLESRLKVAELTAKKVGELEKEFIAAISQIKSLTSICETFNTFEKCPKCGSKLGVDDGQDGYYPFKCPTCNNQEQSDNPNKCCENGKFGDDHICEKQPGSK
jgi:hypothetical protein